MHAGWNQDDLNRASQANLTFTADQAGHIRTEIRVRQEQPGTASAFTLVK
jgi:hypothetical protein